MHKFNISILVILVILLGYIGQGIAEKGTIHLRTSPGATWVISDLSPIFDEGFSIKTDLGYEVMNGLTIQAYYTYLRILAENNRLFNDAHVHSVGGGVRITPLDWIHTDVPVSPWLDLNLGWYRLTRDNDFGFNVGAGIDVKAGDIFRVGPFFRYDHVVRGSGVNDAKMATTGLSFGLAYNTGSSKGTEEEIPEPSVSAAPAAEPAPEPVVVYQKVENDSDNDGLDNDQEAMCKTDPNNPDTDGDGLLDGTEVLAFNRTDPLDPDSDGDGLQDGEEDQNRNGRVDSGETNPMHPDTDHGGIPDGQEVRAGTDPLDPHDPPNEGIKWTLEDVNFEFNKAELLPGSYKKLEAAIRFLQDNPAVIVELGGHTDNIGSDEYNYDLSDQRAKVVADYMTTRGVERQRIVSKGYGEDRPIAPNDLDQGRALNRRTEFTIVSRYGGKQSGSTSRLMPSQSPTTRPKTQVKAPVKEEVIY